MHYNEIYNWVIQNQNRKKTLISLQQPMTAKQLSKKTAISKERCSYLMGKFAALQLCACLNPKAVNSRLYWITSQGKEIQARLQKELNLPQNDIHLHSVNWALYGWVCYNHRSLVLRVLIEPMQPSEIRRRIRHKYPKAKISANNVRDIIHLFEKRGIVKKVFFRKKVHPKYELTEKGLKLQKLLNQAECGLLIQNGKIQKNLGRESKRHSSLSKEAVMG